MESIPIVTIEYIYIYIYMFAFEYIQTIYIYIYIYIYYVCMYIDMHELPTSKLKFIKCSNVKNLSIVVNVHAVSER